LVDAVSYNEFVLLYRQRGLYKTEVYLDKQKNIKIFADLSFLCQDLPGQGDFETAMIYYKQALKLMIIYSGNTRQPEKDQKLIMTWLWNIWIKL
jgi:hypothetical protein